MFQSMSCSKEEKMSKASKTNHLPSAPGKLSFDIQDGRQALDQAGHSEDEKEVPGVAVNLRRQATNSGVGRHRLRSLPNAFVWSSIL